MFIGAHKRADRYSSWPQVAFQIEQRAEQGLPPKSKSFAGVIEDYIRYRERDHRRGKTSAGMLRQIIRVSKFWREYAGELAVEAIDDSLPTNSLHGAVGRAFG